jgi:gamma-tubulin complex component 3
VDPMGEFFIKLNSDVLDDDKFWYDKYSLNEDMIPVFIEKELAEQILVIGKTKTFLRKFCGEYEWNLNVEFIKVENLLSFRYMEGSNYKAFHNWVKKITDSNNVKLKDMILNKYQFLEHCKMIKAFLLLGQGDFINYLIEILQTELYNPATSIFKHNLLSILETAIKSTTANYKHPDFINRLTVRMLEPSFGNLGWDIFSLDYIISVP